MACLSTNVVYNCKMQIVIYFAPLQNYNLKLLKIETKMNNNKPQLI